MKSPFDTLQKELLADGWETIPGKTHRKMKHPEMGLLVFPMSASDHRAIKNIRSTVDRKYREVGRLAPWRRRK